MNFELWKEQYLEVRKVCVYDDIDIVAICKITGIALHRIISVYSEGRETKKLIEDLYRLSLLGRGNEKSLSS